METAVVANHSTRVETLQPELFVVQLSRGFRVRFDEHLNKSVTEAASGKCLRGYLAAMVSRVTHMALHMKDSNVPVA